MSRGALPYSLSTTNHSLFNCYAERQTVNDKRPLSSPADKLHNFEAVAYANPGLGPSRPRQNLHIPLNRHTPAVNPQRFQQLRDVRSRHRFPRFSVYHYGNHFAHSSNSHTRGFARN